MKTNLNTIIMGKLIMTGIIALSSMVVFAGNGEKEIVQSELEKIESLADDVQLLNNNEPTYNYRYVLWRGEYDENGIGYTWGTPIQESPVCQTEAQMEQMKVQLQGMWQDYYPMAIWIVAEVIYECD